MVGANAQAVSNVAGVFPNTNAVQSYQIGFAQGTCNDGTNIYRFNTSQILQLNSNYQFVGGLYIGSNVVTNGLTNFVYLHLGDPDYYQGYIYAPMEDHVAAPQGSANIDVAIFTATNLIRYAAISISNYQSEASAVCIDPAFSNSVAMFVTSWVSTSTNDGIYEYSVNNLTNITFVRTLPMTRNIPRMQGIICVNGMLYVIGDNGPAGEVYQVNPTNGAVVHLAQLNIPGETEWEGLDYYQGFLVAAEATTGTANAYDFFGVLTVSNQNINGTVKDSNNRPIAGAGVIANATISGTNQMASVDTDTNGNYSMIVSGGNWSVAVNCSSGSDSLDNILGSGNYTCPNSQNVPGIYYNATANFIVQFCNVSIVNASSLPAGAVGFPYNQTLQASSCNPSFTWALTGGSLPAGLSLSTNGVVSGTPSGSGGVFNFTVQVTDGNGSSASQTFSLNISNYRIHGSVRDSRNNPVVGVGVFAAAINLTNLATAVVTDTNGNYSLNVINGSWSVALNDNSSSNSLNSLGSYADPASQVVSLVNNTATANFVVQTCDGVSIITPSSLPAGEAGAFYNQALQASSCSPVFTWSQTEDPLPPGLSLTPDGVLSGTPTGPGGVFNFSVNVTDGNNLTTNQTFSLGVSNAVQIATTSLADGTACNVTLSASNGLPPYVWSLSPGSASLPANLTLTTNGLLSGTATATGTFNFSVRVTDALAGVADQLLAINLFQPLTISVSGNQISVLWPAAATNYVLQTTTNLVSPDWEAVAGAMPGSAYTFSNGAPAAYFRLQ